MHKEVAHLLGIAQEVLPEFEHLLDVARLRGFEAGGFLDDVVELKLKPRVLAIGAERFRLGLVRIEDRQDMTDLTFRMPGKFFQSANGDREWGIGWRHVRSFALRGVPLLYPKNARGKYWHAIAPMFRRMDRTQPRT